MTRLPVLRAAIAIRIFCPVARETLAAMLAGDGAAIERDPVAAQMLAIIRADNPLGDFGAYRGVVEIGLGHESFCPTPAARPTLGAAGIVAVSPTVILTTYLDAAIDPAVRDALLALIIAAHPWETPVIELADIALLERGA